LGQALDKAMADLFDLCVTEDACVIAHANRSNESNQGYADRADPAHWVPVFKRWPTLRVCLAHFGTFGAVSAGSSGSQHMPEASWEWELGRYLRQAGDPPVFSDISYLTEIPEDNGQALRDYAAVMKRWLAEFDPDCRHLIFGTDWAMLGIERAYQGYCARIRGFFRDAVGFDKTRLDRVFYGNAARFLGLRQGDAARERVLRFYDRHNVPRSRLPVFPVV
jgi:predicted TIM-barrel fold metal-dependent hydrolase